MRSLRLLSCLALVALTTAAAAQALPRNDQLLILNERVGSYHYLDAFPAPLATRPAIDSYPAALTAFGAPSGFRPDGNLCRVRWAAAGITIALASDLHPCTSGRLFRSAWSGMSLFGPAWHNRLGLRVGDPIAKVQRLYPRASFQENSHRDWLVLLRRNQEELDSVLLAVRINRNGRVSSIEVPDVFIS